MSNWTKCGLIIANQLVVTGFKHVKTVRKLLMMHASIAVSKIASKNGVPKMSVLRQVIAKPNTIAVIRLVAGWSLLKLVVSQTVM